MRVFVAFCLVALALGHPLHNEDSGHVVINNEGSEMANEHLIHERSLMSNGDAVINDESQEVANENVIQKRDVQEVDDNIIQKRDVQNVEDHAIQTREAQEVENLARQDDSLQEAYSNEGGYARQGEGGQYIYASDFGGPMVQILQHVYKANCCACGCDCGCPDEVPDEDGATAED